MVRMLTALGSAIMTQPDVELTDVFRTAAAGFLRWHRVSFQLHKVIRAITRCPGRPHRYLYGCGKGWGLSYNSCRDRHCPKCQAQARQRRRAAREAELLPTPYFHLVFTLPLKLNSLIRAKPVALYNLLFRFVPDTLIEVAANPKRLGAQVGFFAILHTCRWASSGMTAVPPVSGSAHRLKEYRFSEDLRY